MFSQLNGCWFDDFSFFHSFNMIEQLREKKSRMNFVCIQKWTHCALYHIYLLSCIFYARNINALIWINNRIGFVHAFNFYVSVLYVDRVWYHRELYHIVFLVHFILGSGLNASYNAYIVFANDLAHLHRSVVWPSSVNFLHNSLWMWMKILEFSGISILCGPYVLEKL